MSEAQRVGVSLCVGAAWVVGRVISRFVAAYIRAGRTGDNA